VRNDSDVELIRDGVGWTGEAIVVIPDDPAVALADEEGLAPIDATADALAVQPVTLLARRGLPRLAAAAPSRGAVRCGGGG
jgi:hypothetical protein